MARTALDTTGTSHSLKDGGDLINEMTLDLYRGFGGSHGADVPSASTINLNSVTGDLVDVTGTTPITAVTLAEGQKRLVRFTGALTLTHGASLILPGAVNLTTVAGDYVMFLGYASGVVRAVYFGIVQTGKTLWVDSVAGVDANAAPGRADRPYLTPAAAKAAANSGDVIWVRPGSYTFPANSTIWVNGVTWHLEQGAVITQTAAQSDTVSMLTDAVGITGKVTGKGKFILDRTGNGSTAEVVTATLASVVASDYISVYQTSGGGGRINLWFSVNGVGNPPNGRVQIATGTVMGPVGDAGDAKITVTGAGITGSPLVVTAAVGASATSADVASALAGACAGTSAINALYTVTSVGDDIIFTSIAAQANDATLSFTIDNDTCTGLTQSSSNVTQEGIASSGVGGSDTEVALPSSYTNDEAAIELAATVVAGWTLSRVGAVVTFTGTPAGNRTTSTTNAGGRITLGITNGTDMSFLNLASSIATSALEIEFDELKLIFDGLLEATSANYPSVVYQNGPMNLRGNKINKTGDHINGLFWKNGQCHNNVRHVIGGYSGVWSKCTATPTGEFYLDSDLVECVTSNEVAAGWPLYVNGNQAAALWFNVKVWKHPGHHAIAGAGASAGIYHTGYEKVYLGTVNKMYGNIYWLSGAGGGEFYCHIEKLQPAQNGHGGMIYGGVGKGGNINIDVLTTTGFTGCFPTDFNPTSGGGTFVPLRIGYFRAPSGTPSSASMANLHDSFIDYTDCANVNAGYSGHYVGCRFISSGTGVDFTGGNAYGCHGSGTNGMLRHTGGQIMEPRALKQFLTAVGTTGSSGADETLMSFTIGAYTLGTNGDSIKAEYDLTTAAHASATRKIKVLWGGTTIFDSGAVATVAAANVKLEVTVIRLTSTTARALVTLKSGHATLVDMTTDTSLTSQTFTSSIDLILKGAVGTGGSASDVSAKFGRVDFAPSAA